MKPSWILTLFLMVCLAASPAVAQDRQFTLTAPDPLVDSGIFRHVLPRFALKFSTRGTVVDAGAPADLSFGPGPDGRAVFARGDDVWFVTVQTENPHAAKFADWLVSEVGLRTIVSFKPASGDAFVAAAIVEEAPDKPTFDGDSAKGLALSVTHCGRCHVVDRDRRMGGIGSTPSFAALRNFPDWEERFQTFYILKPHPSFTEIADLGALVAPEHRAAIVPLEMSLADLDNILAYVAEIAPADLGAPVQHQ